MNITIRNTINADPETIYHYVLSHTYLCDLLPHLETVNSVEELFVEKIESGLKRQLKYTAPARLPKFLKKYEDRAPDTVSWIQSEYWVHDNSSQYSMRYEIIPDAPVHWREKYSNAGTMSIVSENGRSQIILSFDYSVKLFGLGKIIERALEPEIELLLQAQADIIQKNFSQS